MRTVPRRGVRAVEIDPELVIGVERIAAILGIHERHVPELARRGLPVMTLGWRRATTRKLLREWVEAVARKEAENARA